MIFICDYLQEDLKDTELHLCQYVHVCLGGAMEG